MMIIAFWIFYGHHSNSHDSQQQSSPSSQFYLRLVIDAGKVQPIYFRNKEVFN